MPTDPGTVRAALSRLNPDRDDHWTTQGLPRMDALESFGLKVDRREINEIMPGFNRAAAATRASLEAQPEPTSTGDAEEDYVALSSRHIVARAERRKAALEHLLAGGFTLKDIEPVRSKLDLGTRARNRAARRAG
jgi:hypothetical protein